jgi:hypothetical protein
MVTNPNPKDPNQLLSTFTTLPQPLVHEHGLPQLALAGDRVRGLEVVGEL